MSSQKKSVVEITDETKMNGKMQVCLLHRSDSREVKQFELFSPKEGGPRKPGFYRANPDSMFLKEGFRKGTDGKYWGSLTLTVDDFEYLGTENPLASKAAPAVAPAVKPLRAA